MWAVLKNQDCRNKEHFVFFYFKKSKIKNIRCSYFSIKVDLRILDVSLIFYYTVTMKIYLQKTFAFFYWPAGTKSAAGQIFSPK